MDIKYLENIEIYESVILDGIRNADHSIWIATANVKDLRVEEDKRYVSINKLFRDLCRKNVELRILHSSIPSEAFLKDFKKYRLGEEKRFLMRRCPRVHFKCVLIDGKRLFVGSPNLTGAGLGAKGENRRNFEIGILTENPELIKHIRSLFLKIWEGKMCSDCGRKKFCYVPLEEPI